MLEAKWVSNSGVARILFLGGPGQKWAGTRLTKSSAQIGGPQPWTQRSVGGSVGWGAGYTSQYFKYLF